MDNLENRSKVRKSLTIANSINSIFTALLLILEVSIGVGIKYCQQAVTSLTNSVHSADAESYMGGYQVIGGLFGAGATTIVLGLLYLLLAVSSLYLVAFLTENILGYRLAFLLKTEPYNEVLIKKAKRNAVFKCILALLIIIPESCFVFSAQWLQTLVIIIPQVCVILLALHIIQILPKSA